MSEDKTFKLTYASMFNPPEELHQRFDAALGQTRQNLGRDYGMLINGKEVYASEKVENRSPADTRVLLGLFQKGTTGDARDAIAAAKGAFAGWSRTPWQERVRLVRKAAEIMDTRLYEISVAVSLEVGKSRMEALGDVAETADLFRYACDRMEANNGYIAKMGRDPLPGFISTNTSVLRPHGVWLVISPFNFPAALSGGPTAAALVTGNTVVLKPASDTPWTARLITECLMEAGLPAGVINYVTGPGSSLGQGLIESSDVAGVTFTGSVSVGMQIYHDFSLGSWVRPTILEMGGKNAAIVTRHANLDDAATGIARSAFGLQGQKCSACSRVLVEEAVYDELVGKLVDITGKMVIGDPTDRGTYLGPVINQNSYQDYAKFVDDLSKHGRVLTGGMHLTDGAYTHGYFCAPTLVDALPFDHHLWQEEMFLPITTIGKVDSLDLALHIANQVSYGLTAGIYGSEDDVARFFDQIEAGVTYANRPQGATTGAWPGFQPFGGWKGSGSTGKNSGGLYYLPLYMREQIRTHLTRV